MNELDKAFESFARPMGKENSAEMRMYFMAGVAYADNTVAKLMLEVNRLRSELDGRSK